MKKILFINPHFALFATPTCGGANRSQMFLKALTHVGHVDVVSLWENEKSNLPNCDVVYSGCPDFGSIPQYGKIEKFIRLLAPWNVNNIFPLNKSVECFCDEFIKKGDYDYIAVRYLFTAAEFGLLKYADRLIVDVDDNPKNTLLVRSEKANTYFRKLYLKYAAVSAGFMTRMALKKIHASFYSNPEQIPASQSVFLHNVSVRNAPLPTISNSTSKRVLVLGSWSYFPNHQGLTHFLKNIWPAIISAISNAELRVVGRNMEEPLVSLCSQSKGVSIVGFVDDVMTEYQDVRCVIVPIYYGSGTCVKVIETMSVNRPFVATPCGIRGIENDIQPGKDFLLAKNDNEFAAHVITLLKKPEYGALLATNALHCAQSKYSVDKFINIVKESIM